MPWQAVVEHGLLTAAIHVVARVRHARFLKCRVIRPNAEIRVSFSALLRIAEGGRYLLVRSIHRPDFFGPFGGVYKYFDEAKPHLDEVQFKPEDLGPDDDMRNDLRGFLPRRYLPRHHKWFLNSEARESPGACLYRELCEELKEAKVKGLTPPPAMSLRRIRAIEEGPEDVPGRRYMQYRVFEVYEPVVTAVTIEQFKKRLFRSAQDNSDLLVANAEEILTGRARDDRLIGHHAVYLIAGRRIRREGAPFAHRPHGNDSGQQRPDRV